MSFYLVTGNRLCAFRYQVSIYTCMVIFLKTTAALSTEYSFSLSLKQSTIFGQLTFELIGDDGDQNRFDIGASTGDITVSNRPNLGESSPYQVSLPKPINTSNIKKVFIKGILLEGTKIKTNKIQHSAQCECL